MAEFDTCTLQPKVPIVGYKSGDIMTEYISAAGEDLASETSDATPDGPNTRHHLLRHKLTLDEKTSSDKAAAESDAGMQKSKQRAGSLQLNCKDTRNWSVWTVSACFALMSDFDFCQADSERDADGDEAEPEDLGMSEELSQSEDEDAEDKLKR